MFELTNFFDFNILTADDIYTIKNIPLNNIDLINIYIKTNFGFWRPQKIIWRLKIDKQNPFSYILSKKERKKIRKLLQNENYQIKIQLPLEEENFQKWFKIYQEMINKKEKGVIRIDEHWLLNKNNDRRLVGGVFAYENYELRGGSIFIVPKNDSSRLSVCYTAFLRENENKDSLRPLVEYYFMKYGIENNYKILTRGKDTNLYGMHLSLGLFEIKSRYGYQPFTYEGLPKVETFFLNHKKFINEEALFLGFNGEEKTLFYLTEKEQDCNLPNRFCYTGLPLKILKFSQVTKNHRNILTEKLMNKSF